MRITGTLLKVEPYSGTFPDEKDGHPVPYSGVRLHVLDGVEVIKVKVPKDQLLTHGYGAGEAVDLAVTVQANQGARGAFLTTTLVGSFEPGVTGTGEPAPKSSARISAVS
jgi:hypothetical protein